MHIGHRTGKRPGREGHTAANGADNLTGLGQADLHHYVFPSRHRRAS